MFGRIMTLIVLTAAITLGVLLQSTSPVESGPAGILAVFFCMYIVLLGLSSLLIRVMSWLYVYVIPFPRQKKEIISVERSYYYGSVLAFGPTTLFAINSIGSLGIYEYILAVLFVGIGLFYVKKRS